MVKKPQTPQTPALFIAWIDSKQNINVSSSTNNGQTWQSLPSPGQTSPFSPALAYFKNNLYLAWTGTGSPKLNVMSYGGGTQWTNQQTPGDQCNAGPALAASEHVLCMAHAGNDDTHSLNISCSSNGSNWNPQINFDLKGEITVQSPALALGEFQLPVLAWIAGSLVEKPVSYISGVECMVVETHAHRAPLSSTFSPALAFFNHRFFIAYINTTNNLKLKASADGFKWPDQTTPGTVTTSAGPALTASATTLYLAWAQGGQLQVSTFTTAGSGTWGPRNPVKDASGNPVSSGQAPALAYGNAFSPLPPPEKPARRSAPRTAPRSPRKKR